VFFEPRKNMATPIQTITTTRKKKFMMFTRYYRDAQTLLSNPLVGIPSSGSAQIKVSAAGGDPSPQERAIIGDSVKNMLYIASLDNYLMGLKSLVRKGRPHPVLYSKPRQIARSAVGDYVLSHFVEHADVSDHVA
jgi:hypothetical protein